MTLFIINSLTEASTLSNLHNLNASKSHYREPNNLVLAIVIELTITHCNESNTSTPVLLCDTY